MPQLHNDQEVLSFLNKAATTTINNVSAKVLKILREAINQYTYKSHPSNVIYVGGTGEPSGEFYYAFQLKDIVHGVNSITKELFYNWEGMSYDRPTVLHSSIVPSWPEDVRENLAKYLDVSGLSSRHWISVERDPYWTITVHELFDGRLLDDWFNTELLKFGFKRI